jgi:hypothetical protein
MRPLLAAYDKFVTAISQGSNRPPHHFDGAYPNRDT